MIRVTGTSLLAAGLLVACASAPPVVEEPIDALYAEHRHQGRYYNPWAPFTPSWMGLIKAYLRPNPYADAPELPVPRRALSLKQLTPPPAPQISWLGHATTLIQAGGSAIVTDPHLTERALIYRRQSAPALAAEQVATLPELKLALISHNHYDHLDADTVAALPADLNWLVPAGLGAWFRARGRHRVHALDWWQQVRVDGWLATCVPLQHWSSRIGMGRDTSLWCGWLLERDELRVLFVGDSGYFHGFAEIGRRFGPIDVAILPIGAYAPRDFLGYQHMDPAQAWQATQDLQARYLIPVHWGAFDFSQEPLAEPPQELMRQVRAAGGDPRRAVVLPVGGQWRLPADAKPSERPR